MCVRRFFLHTFHFICHLVFVESIHHPLGGLHSGSLVSSFQYTESSEVFLISSFVASPYSAFFIPCLCFASTFLFPFHTILTTKLALSQVSWWNHNWQCWCLTSSPSRKRSHGTATNSSIAAMRPRKGGETQHGLRSFSAKRQTRTSTKVESSLYLSTLRSLAVGCLNIQLSNPIRPKASTQQTPHELTMLLYLQRGRNSTQTKTDNISHLPRGQHTPQLQVHNSN